MSSDVVFFFNWSSGSDERKLRVHTWTETSGSRDGRWRQLMILVQRIYVYCKIFCAYHERFIFEYTSVPLHPVVLLNATEFRPLGDREGQ